VCEARQEGATRLDLSRLRIESLPPEIAGLTALRSLHLSNTQITDAGLPHITGLTALHTLVLVNTQITGAGLPHIASLAALRSLYLSNTQITDAGLTNIAGLTALQNLLLVNTQITDASLPHIAGLTALRTLTLDNTQITDAGLRHIAGLTALRRLNLNDTTASDLRPLRNMPLLTEGPWSSVECLTLTNTPALHDFPIAVALYRADPEERRKALLAHLHSLPPWPEPLPRTAESQPPQSEPAPRTFKPLTVSTARAVLEQDYPLVRDRCQAVMGQLSEGLAYHALRIPNDSEALEDHRQIEQSLVFAQGLVASVHDALPEDFTDRPLTDAEVNRFKTAFNAALVKLEEAFRYVDRPDHTPTIAGMMRLGVATALGGIVSLVPGVGATAAIPLAYTALYGKEGAKSVISALKASGPTEGS
jgi:hypothetical protein